MAGPQQEQFILESFKKFDQNGDGTISRDELARVLNSVSNGKFNDAAVDKMLAASDTNKDGKIDTAEFVAWVMKDSKAQDFKPIDARGALKVDYRKFLPERFKVDLTQRYDVDKLELGAGGFGTVFIARDKEFQDRKVAVKKVEKPKASKKSISDLDKEIAVMKELDHPNICKLLATFEEGRSLFFIMELCEGGEVFDRIIETGSVSERTTSIIVGQVVAALAYANGRGIAHRDIKPENVVFCSKDRNDLSVKLIDWGLATNFESEGMTQAVGSMTYAAPEVIMSGDRRAYSEACDLWSVGVLTYVMLSGRPPFWGTREQHLRNAKAEKYPFKDDPWKTMNPQAKDFIQRLLKADPKKRIPINECTQHAWIKTPPSEASAENTSMVLGNLKNFCAQSTFSRMCITAVARQLDHKRLADIHQVFRAMDKDGNGVLSVEEVTDGIKQMGGETSDIAALFSNLDMDGSKSIDYTEFCAAGLGQRAGLQKDVIWAAFKTFDVDNVGYISVKNLKEILDSADVRDTWSPEVCNQVGAEIVAKFDKDADGRISFEEWQKLMSECWEKKTTGECISSTQPYDLLLKVNELNL